MTDTNLANWTDATHLYQPVDSFNPRCTGGWFNDKGDWINCNSTQKDSILHMGYGDGCWRGCCASDADHRQRHDHGGGDCMCFEMED